jgi:hypothetical protein
MIFLFNQLGQISFLIDDAMNFYCFFHHNIENKIVLYGQYTVFRWDGPNRVVQPMGKGEFLEAIN